jgi:hypothetical protein
MLGLRPDRASIRKIFLHDDENPIEEMAKISKTVCDRIRHSLWVAVLATATPHVSPIKIP